MPDIETKPEFMPPASRRAAGCLFLPGCLGGVVAVILAISILAHTLALIWAWVNEKALPLFPIQNTPREWAKLVWLLLSFFAWQAMRGGKRQPWVYWLTQVCLAGWIGIAWTTDSLRVQLGPFTETPAEASRNGQWLATIVIGVFLGHFAMSRDNRLYYGISRQKQP
jgi:hypothetical protein